MPDRAIASSDLLPRTSSAMPHKPQIGTHVSLLPFKPTSTYSYDAPPIALSWRGARALWTRNRKPGRFSSASTETFARTTPGSQLTASNTADRRLRNHETAREAVENQAFRLLR